jgi:hypothetical protein
LLGLLFNPENRGDIFFQNVGYVYWTTMCFIPEFIISIATAVRNPNPTFL